LSSQDNSRCFGKKMREIKIECSYSNKIISLDGRKFSVNLSEEKIGGYSVRCLELPQAISQGETKKEALTNVKEAIELVLEYSALKNKPR